MPRSVTVPPRAKARLASWLLLAYLLVLAAAGAAPWLAPQPYGPLCSAGLPLGKPAKAPTLDCAQCLPLQAPPLPMPLAAPPTPAPPAWGVARATPHPTLSPPALPPARGPPVA